MNKDNFAGLLIGLGAGVALGMLFAPKSGAESRALLTDAVSTGADTVKKQAAEAWDSAAGAVERSRAELSRRQEGIKSAVEAGKKAYQEAAG